MNYTANFLWIGRCRGELATSLRLRGATLKAFAEVGLSSAVRAVLAKALDPGAAGLRAELDPNGNQLQKLIVVVSQLVASQASQQEEIRNFVKSSIAAALQSSVVEITRQSTASSLKKEEELRSVCRQLPGGAAGVMILKDYGHLPVTAFLEQKLSSEQHYVIRSFMPVFATAVQEARLDLTNNPNTEKPYMAWSNGSWRLVYFEADREMMDAIFAEPRAAATLTRMLADMVPVGDACKRRKTSGGYRRGPHAVPQGSSANINVNAVRSFFGDRAE